MKKIAVIDYGMSNLHSVIKSFQKASDKRYKLCVVTSEKKLKDASMIILPGQGAAKSCMQKLSESFPNLSDFILNKPFFGICLGFQILFEKSFEDDGVNCLSVIEGSVNDFRKQVSEDLKVPHMGWNNVEQKNDHAIWNNIPRKSFFYFVHSYYALAKSEENISSITKYDINFTSSVIKDNLFACQFHPEKSSKYGLQLISNFINWSESLQ